MGAFFVATEKGASVSRTSALRQERAGLVTEMRAMLDKAETDHPDGHIPSETQEKHDRLFAQQEDLRVRIEREERTTALEHELGESQGVLSAGTNIVTSDPLTPAAHVANIWDAPSLRALTVNDEARTRFAHLVTPEYNAAYERFLRAGTNALSPDQARSLMAPEVKALQVDSDTAGGYLVMPMQMVGKLIQAVDDSVFVRQHATKFQVEKADSLGAPSLDNDPSDSDWTSELAIGSEDTTMSFGNRELKPHPLAKFIKISNKLLRAATMSAEDLVIQRLRYKFAVTEEKGFLTGSGAGQPLGIFTASANGISTARDVSTGNTTTSMTFDGLKEAKYTLKGQYHGKARWAFHRDGVKQIDKLKDGNGQYVWEQSVKIGEPDRLLGFPVEMSEYAPNTFTTGLYTGILGDFSHYWIADALLMEIQRLVELYAGANQTGFIGRLECDGMPVLEEAFVRVKLA